MIPNSDEATTAVSPRKHARLLLQSTSFVPRPQTPIDTTLNMLAEHTLNLRRNMAMHEAMIANARLDELEAFMRRSITECTPDALATWRNFDKLGAHDCSALTTLFDTPELPRLGPVGRASSALTASALGSGRTISGALKLVAEGDADSALTTLADPYCRWQRAHL